MHLGSGTVAGPETVTGGHRPVHGGPRPICLAARLEGNAAFHVIQAGHEDGGIVIGESWPRNHNKQAEHQENAHTEICKTDRCLHHSTPSGRAIGAPFSGNRHLKVKEFSETLISQPNQAEPWMLVSLRLLNALRVRIKLKPKAYC